jgi:hypothetical protein
MSSECPDLDEGTVGQGHTHSFSLAAVAVLRKEAAGHASGRDAVAAVRTGSVAEGEGCDDEVAPGDITDLSPHILDDTDELVSDRARLERRLSAVVPEVRPANASQRDSHDRVRRLHDRGVRTLADGYGTRFIEYGGSHRSVSHLA